MSQSPTALRLPQDNFDVYSIAGKARVDPRTVRALLAGQRKRSPHAVKAAVHRACIELGFGLPAGASL